MAHHKGYQEHTMVDRRHPFYNLFGHSTPHCGQKGGAALHPSELESRAQRVWVARGRNVQRVCENMCATRRGCSRRSGHAWRDFLPGAAGGAPAHHFVSPWQLPAALSRRRRFFRIIAGIAHVACQHLKSNLGGIFSYT